MQEQDDNLEFISKTKLKAEADAQQMVGKKLLALTNSQVDKLHLEESLHDAIMEAKRLTSNGAIRRQLQYIGKLMRSTEIEPILEQLARWQGKNNEENARFHALERWRDRLINDSATSSTLQAFLTQYPNAEIQQVRTLCRNAQKELSTNKPPKSSRELFKLLREISDNQQQSNEN
ncbi:MAG: ribosome biogenesis factor YjgA [Methylophilaceae bacterium]